MIANLSKLKLISYGSLAFAIAFIGLPIYIYLPNYYHSNFGFDLKLMAIVLLATRMLDTIQDPIFGILSDKFSHLKRKIILFTTPILGFAFLFLFHPLTENYLTTWIVIFLILTYSSYSIVYINFQSFAVGLSSDYNEKTRIIAYREVFFILGIIFAAGAPAILFNYYSEVDSFFIIGVLYFFVICILALIFYFYAPKSSVKKVEGRGSFKEIFKESLIKKFFLIFLLNSISASIPAALILFFIEEVLVLKEYSGLFMILYFSGLMVGTILWTKISKIMNDKVMPWIYGMTIALCSFVWCYFLGEGDMAFYAIICIVSGIGFGADFSLGYSILTDVIQEKKLQKSETTIFGIANFIVKISLALSSSVLIYFIGYFDEVSQIQKKEFISFSYTILPVLFRIVGMVILYKYFRKQQNA